ncbi:hypothetical protein ACQ4PT_034715 [Festuca glaucescens]
MAPGVPKQLGVRLPENEEVARLLLEKHRSMLEKGLTDNLSLTLSTAYRNVCGAKEHIRTLKDLLKIKSHGMRVVSNIHSKFRVPVEIKRLPVGDGIWIARHRRSRTEYVLDFIVERKGVTDLVSSIRDSRCLTTEILEGFDVQRTTGYPDTEKTYGHLTLSIIDYYSTNFSSRASTSRVCLTYDEFVKKCSDPKKLTVSDIFALQLMQVPHVTEETALAVTELYPTLLSLARAYSMLDGNTREQEQMLNKKSKMFIQRPASHTHPPRSMVRSLQTSESRLHPRRPPAAPSLSTTALFAFSLRRPRPKSLVLLYSSKSEEPHLTPTLPDSTQPPRRAALLLVPIDSALMAATAPLPCAPVSSPASRTVLWPARSNLRTAAAPPSGTLGWRRRQPFPAVSITPGSAQSTPPALAVDPEVEALLDSVKWDVKGLAVAIAQNVDTGAILMQGFANREALAATISTRKATFYSRSRSSLWTKGETSMNFINVHDIFLDCDRDSIIYLGTPDGPTCHTGAETCYYYSVYDVLQGSKSNQERQVSTTLYSLEDTISKRKKEIVTEGGGKPSWTKKLLLDNQLLCSKIREEAGELIQTLLENEDKSLTASEMGDLLYHAMVLLSVKDVKMEEVLEVLRKRFSQSGVEEKASRKKS